MRTNNHTHILLFSILISCMISCQPSDTTKQESQHSKPVIAEISKGEAERQPYFAKKAAEQKEKNIQMLLEMAVENDSLEVLEIKPFLYFKSFHLRENTLNVIRIETTKDDKFDIKIYQKENDDWQVIAHLDTLEARLVQFDLLIDDYNFDQVNDFYIQQSASNGLVQSFGHLILSQDNQFIPSNYGYEYPNLRPIAKEKIIISENVIFCEDLGKDLCKKTLAWQHNLLVPIKETCPCEPDKNE